MRKNRIFFSSLWIILVILLFIFPGPEKYPLHFGLMPGWWPFMFMPDISLWISFPVMLIICAVLMVVTSSLMDKTGKYKIFCSIALVVVLFFGFYFIGAGGAEGYDEWKNDNNITTASFETAWLYYRQVIIPYALAGGLIGLYLVSILFGMASVVILIIRKGKTKASPPENS